MKIEQAVALIKDKLPEKRVTHSLNVAETAVKLAEIYDGDAQKLSLPEYYMIIVSMMI